LSEPVTGAAASLKGTDFTYVNVYDTDDPIAMAAGITVLDADSTLFTVLTDTDIAVERAMVDSITVATVQDLATAPNVGVTKNVAFYDAVMPTLESATTMDVNGNGQIDNIKLVFSESINAENIDNYQGTSDEGIIRASSGTYTLGGYKVLGVNLTVDQDGADVASFSVGATVYNVNDEARDDEILYLAVKESGEPDTDSILEFSMVTGPSTTSDVASGIGDFTPNYVVVDSFDVEDGAGPGIFNAWMPSETELQIILSEEVEEPLPTASGNFAWIVGNQLIDYVGEGWILSLEQLDPGILTMKVQNGTNVPEGMVSTIAFLVADVLEDAEGNGNIVTPEALDVLPFITAVEEDNLPDAFALSKNFPNPFNPTTTIEYAIPADGAGHVEMVIYNINGQKVRTLVNETKDAGYYNVVWDGRSDSGEMVSSGLYMYKIVSGSFSKIQKMTFMK
jgi:hypothetical protein